MKKNQNLLGILLFVGLALAACTSEDALIEPTAPQQDRTWKVSATISKDADATTRALTLSDNMLNVGWTTTEKIYVKKTSTGQDLGYLSPTADTNTSSTPVSGLLSGAGYQVNDQLTLVFPKKEKDYSGQDGTLATIAANYDYATATTTVASVSGADVTLAATTLVSQQAIVKFIFSQPVTEVAISSPGINVESNSLTVTLASPQTEVFVAMPVTSSAASYLFGCKNSSNGKRYDAKKDGIEMQNGKYYIANVELEEFGTSTPLTLEAATRTANIIIVKYSELPIKYKRSSMPDVQTSTEYEITIADVNPGEYVQFFADGFSYDDRLSIICDEDCYVYGNVMSLISSSSFSTLTDLTSHHFSELFYNSNGNSHIINHPYKDILLPATTLSSGCYYDMFNGCTGLTRAPELPATNLSGGCYRDMFYGCTGLTKAPELPATTLADNCYDSMFRGCTGLTKAPELPATTLAEWCYNYMFHGCTGLTSPPELPAKTLAKRCYQGMFVKCTNLREAPALPAKTLVEGCYGDMFAGCYYLTTAPALPATTMTEGCYARMFFGCTDLTTAPALPATTLARDCYLNMFNSCTSLTTAPVLPAPVLEINCYTQMFKGCNKLNYVKCLATDITARDGTKNWLDDVASSGTFVTPSETQWTSDVSGIPSGWTRENYVAP